MGQLRMTSKFMEVTNLLELLLSHKNSPEFNSLELQSTQEPPKSDVLKWRTDFLPFTGQTHKEKLPVTHTGASQDLSEEEDAIQRHPLLH